MGWMWRSVNIEQTWAIWIMGGSWVITKEPVNVKWSMREHEGLWVKDCEQFRKFVNECEKTRTIWKGMWLMWPTMRDCEWQVNMSDCEIFDQSLQVICEQKWGMIYEWKPGMIWEWRAICEWQTSRSELCIFNKINYVHSMSDNVSSFVSPNQF